MGETLTHKSLGDYVSYQRGRHGRVLFFCQPGPVLLGLASIAPNGGFRSDNLKTYGGHSNVRMLLEPGDIYRISEGCYTVSDDLLEELTCPRQHSAR